MPYISIDRDPHNVARMMPSRQLSHHPLSLHTPWVFATIPQLWVSFFDMEMCIIAGGQPKNLSDTPPCQLLHYPLLLHTPPYLLSFPSCVCVCFDMDTSYHWGSTKKFMHYNTDTVVCTLWQFYTLHLNQHRHAECCYNGVITSVVPTLLTGSRRLGTCQYESCRTGKQ